MERGLIDIYCLLKKQPTVALPVARTWMKHVLTAIHHLHELRIIHQVPPLYRDARRMAVV
jgi:hypothetical protein